MYSNFAVSPLDPNSVLSTAQLIIMAVVPSVLLAGWLIVVNLVAREPGRRDRAAAGAPERSAARTSQYEPKQPPSAEWPPSP